MQEWREAEMQGCGDGSTEGFGGGRMQGWRDGGTKECGNGGMEGSRDAGKWGWRDAGPKAQMHAGAAGSPAVGWQEHDAAVGEADLHFSRSCVVLRFVWVFLTGFLNSLEVTRSFLTANPSPLLSPQPFTADHHEELLFRRELDAAAHQSVSQSHSQSITLHAA